MKALVTVASKHGATEEIGRAVADRLIEEGLFVDVVRPERVESLDGYDLVVVGSAIYLGQWMKAARDFVELRADELRRLPVWLFGSGPISHFENEGDTAEGKRLQALVGAREARLFPGRLQQRGLNIFERVSVSMVGSPWGDYRPWETIDEWAKAIAGEVKVARAAV